MKIFCGISFGFILLLIYLNCNKPVDPTPATEHINCDGLITDTAGTNDTGRVYIPNAFTPDNNDGLNDEFMPYTKGVSSIEVTIYDDNNKVVFNTSELKKGWHPVDNTSEVKYYYKVQAVTTNGHKIGACGDLYRLTCFPKDIPQDSLAFPTQLTPAGFASIPSGEPMSACP